MIELDLNVLGFNQEKVLKIKNIKIEKIYNLILQNYQLEKQQLKVI